VKVICLENPVIKNILWDVNDTLFDTHPAVTYAFSKTISGMGCSIALNVIDGLVRQHPDDCVTILSQRFKLDPDLLRAKFRESYRAVSPANQPPFPGVREVLEFIHQLGGLNLAITHRSMDSTQRFLDAHAMSALIDDILSSQQGYPNKPDPSMALAALSKHSLNPDETLLIGDRERDILAGHAAGIHTCLFGNAKLSTPADFQVTDYQRLLHILKGN